MIKRQKVPTNGNPVLFGRFLAECRIWIILPFSPLSTNVAFIDMVVIIGEYQSETVI